MNGEVSHMNGEVSHMNGEVSRPAKSHGISMRLQKLSCYTISRNVGTLIELLFFCNKACFWCESDRRRRDADVKLAPASGLRLHKHA